MAQVLNTNVIGPALLTKALYEVDYEANNRPDWIEIPARGVLTILDTDGHEPGATV